MIPFGPTTASIFTDPAILIFWASNGVYRDDQFHPVELFLGLFRRLQVFLRGRKRLVAEPDLQRAHVNPRPKPRCP
jgi:hypothetical protein